MMQARQVSLTNAPGITLRTFVWFIEGYPAAHRLWSNCNASGKPTAQVVELIRDPINKRLAGLPTNGGFFATLGVLKATISQLQRM